MLYAGILELFARSVETRICFWGRVDVVVATLPSIYADGIADGLIFEQLASHGGSFDHL